jgi:shikimate dehydrogenase
MQACNCVKIENGKLKGYNTDVIGFEKSFKPLLQPHHTHALILGTGGAAQAVEFVLQKLGIQYGFVSRTPKAIRATMHYDALDEGLMQQYTVIINTTPLGTYPDVDTCPPIPYHWLSPQHYLFDLVYNPEKTLFLTKGQQRGTLIKNGYDMLVIQAEENWKIWNKG